MKIPELSEKVIENQILNYLMLKKIFAWKNQSTGVYDPTKKLFRKSMNPFHINGVSDILAIYNGRFIAIEVKRKTGKVSEHQKTYIERIKKEGGIAFVARSLEDVIIALAEHKIG